MAGALLVNVKYRNGADTSDTGDFRNRFDSLLGLSGGLGGGERHELARAGELEQIADIGFPGHFTHRSLDPVRSRGGKSDVQDRAIRGSPYGGKPLHAH